MSAVEVLVTLGIASLLISITVPALVGHVRRAHAASIVADYRRIRDAAQLEYEASGGFSGEAPEGVEPAGLAPFLGGRIEWNRTDRGYRYDWEYWADEAGQPTHPETGILIGFSVSVTDARLGEALQRVYTGRIVQTHPDRFAFPVVPLGTVSLGRAAVVEDGAVPDPATVSGVGVPSSGSTDDDDGGDKDKKPPQKSPASSSKGKGNAVGHTDGKGNNG